MQRKSFGICMLMVAFLVSIESPAGEQRVEVPFKLYRDYVIVFTGSIGPIEKLNFLLDTAAVPSVIDQRVARRLRLTGPTERLLVFSKDLRARRVSLPDVRVGPVSATSVAVLVQDLSFIEDGLGVRVDGMIGLDVLGQASFTIDYGEKKLVFGPVELEGASHSIQSRPGFVYLTIHVQGEPLYLVVDTGAKDLVIFSARVGSRINSLRTQSTKTASNMGGEVALKQVQLLEARLGTNDLGTLNAFLLDNPAQRNRGFDGLLGVRSLGLTHLAFDFERRRICWR